MKKSTKRLLSTVLAASMLFTSVYVSPVTAATADETVVAAAVDPAVAWSADDLAIAAKGTLTTTMTLGNMYSFQPNAKNAAVDANNKTFSDGFSFAQRLKPGGAAKTDGTNCFTITAPSAGKLKVYFVTGSNAEGRTVSFMDSAYAELATATSGPIADATTYVYEPAVFDVPAAGTYHVGGMAAAVNFYGMTFAPEGTEFPTEATTEAVTEATTEAPTEGTTVEGQTEASTEAPTEGTTAAPVQTDRMEGDIVSDTDNLATGSYFGGQLEIHDLTSAGAEAAAWTKKPVDSLNPSATQEINGRTYTSFVQGANNPKDAAGKNSYNAQGKLVVPEQGAFIKVVPTADATLMLDFKVASGKQYAFMSVDAAGAKTELDFIAPTADEFFHKEYALTAGNTYYVTSAGTKTCFFGIALAGGAPVETTEATTAATTEATTEATTVATTEETTETSTQEVVTVEGKLEVNAYVDGVEKVDGTQKVAAAEVGKTVKVNVDVTNGGYNNYTFFLKYNPSVLKAKAVADPADVASYSTYNGTPVYDPATVNASINYVPKNDNTDYTDVNADGTKTCAELGKIKFANYLPNAGAKADKGGTVVAVEFDVVGEGSSDLEIILVENGFFAEPGTAQLEVTAPETVKVNVGDETTESTETTTEAKTEETTKESTQATTEETTETTTEEVTVPAGTLGLKVTPNGKFDLEAGDELVLNIDTNNADTASFNNYTFFLTYNPKVIEAVEAVDPENPAKTANGAVAYDKNNVNSSISFVPSKTNPDFADVAADDATSSAALGKIKIANYVNPSSDTISVDGSLLSIKFVVKGEGNADINVTVVGFYGAETADALNVQVIPADVIIAAEETTSESTTETSTESSTETSTESSTETSTESTTETVIGLEAVGDVNMDGIWTADDAAFLLQRVLDRTFNLPCADPAFGGYPDAYYYIADVTADGILTADDAANILQRALDSSFAFKMDEVVKGNVPYEYPVE